MKFVVIGPGALGCLLAASLSLADRHSVWLLDHDRERAAILDRQGLCLSRDGAERRCPVRATSDARAIAPASDVLLLCVKSHQLAAALDRAAPLLLAKTTLTVCFQNGIGHLELLARHLAQGSWAAGVTAQGATLTGPGRVRHGGNGPTSLGFLEPASAVAGERLDQLAAALSASGIATQVVADIQARIWRKLLVNVGINALTAIRDCTNGELPDSAPARERLADAVLEAARVAAASGIRVDDDPVAMTLAVCRATAANSSSMRQDVRNRRRTEIDAINGAVVAEGRKLGIPVPENQTLVHEIKEIERGYLGDSS